jgi:hypothetical protein
MATVIRRTHLCHLFLGLGLAAGTAATANDIVRCKAPDGSVTYQAGPCPDRAVESRPRIATAYPEPNRAESQRIFEREAALDKLLVARRERELVEQQMREARAEREAERRHQEFLAAQQQQYVIAWQWGRAHPPVRPVHHLPRHTPQAIFR